MSRATTTTTALPGAPNSINANINSLIASVAWAGPNLTFSFPTGTNQLFGYSADAPEIRGFSPAGDSYKAAVRVILGQLSELTNLRFTEVAPATIEAEASTLKFGISSIPNPRDSTAGWAIFPGNTADAGDNWIRDTQRINDPFGPGSFNWQLLIHEIGHSIGLNHPFEGGGVGGSVVMDPLRDTNEWTAMAYRASASVEGVRTVGFAETNGLGQTWMIYDTAALQQMYGANYGTRAGNTVYSWNPNTGQALANGQPWLPQPAANRILENVWDGGGIDTFDFSNYTTNVTVDIRPGGWSTPSPTQLPIANTEAAGGPVKAVGSISVSFLVNNDPRSLIENVTTGSGNDSIVGNQARNVITPGAGRDSVDGADGLDTVVFSAGRSQAQIQAGGGTITVTIGGEADALTNVERLKFSDSILAFDLDGNAGQAYRLYQAAFARTPDQAGVSFWTNRIDGGTSLSDVAAGFVSSQEFRTVYGASPTNAEIVGRIYQNVLNRPGEAAGVNFWVGELNSGARTLPQVLAGFSESAENKQLVGVSIANGIVLDLAPFA